MLALSLRITILNSLALLMVYWLCGNVVLAFLGGGIAVFVVEIAWDKIYLNNSRNFEQWAYFSAFVVGGVAYGVGVSKMLYYSQPILDVSSVRDIEKNYFSEEEYYFFVTEEPFLVNTEQKGSYYYVTTDDDGDETEHYYEVYPLLDTLGHHTSVMLGFTDEQYWATKSEAEKGVPYLSGTYRVASSYDWSVAAADLFINIMHHCGDYLDCDDMERDERYRVVLHEKADPYAKRITYRTIATIFVIIANIIILIDGLMIINTRKRN